MEFSAIIVVIMLIVLLVRAVGRFGTSADSIGNVGEARTRRYLNRLPQEDYIVLNDLMVCDKDGVTTQIDHVVLSQYGIFVIETKCYSGWIFGDEKSRVWTQTLPCGRGWWAHSEKHTFQNPIRQNWRHIYVLAKRLNLPKRYFFNVVVFSGSAELKTETPDNVIDETNVCSYIRSFERPIMNMTMRERLATALQRLDSSVSAEQRSRHVHTLYILHTPPPTVRNDSDIPPCPRCGATMRLRHRHADNVSFYGCSRYPHCKGTVNIA